MHTQDITSLNTYSQNISIITRQNIDLQKQITTLQERNAFLDNNYKLLLDENTKLKELSSNSQTITYNNTCNQEDSNTLKKYNQKYKLLEDSFYKMQDKYNQLEEHYQQIIKQNEVLNNHKQTTFMEQEYLEQIEKEKAKYGLLSQKHKQKNMELLLNHKKELQTHVKQKSELQNLLLEEKSKVKQILAKYRQLEQFSIQKIQCYQKLTIQKNKMRNLELPDPNNVKIDRKVDGINKNFRVMLEIIKNGESTYNRIKENLKRLQQLNNYVNDSWRRQQIKKFLIVIGQSTLFLNLSLVSDLKNQINLLKRDVKAFLLNLRQAESKGNISKFISQELNRFQDEFSD